MRCRPSRWLWGLLPLAMLAFLVNVGERQRIEKDLTTRTTAALDSAGHAWAAGSFRGRDGTIAGTAEEEAQQTAALKVARSVWGARIARDNTSLVELIRPYAWSAKREPGVIRLTGYVPSDAERKEIIAAAKANFPVAQIDDQLRLGRGVADRPSWRGGTAYGLGLLAKLDRGEVRLDEMDLSVSGVASSPADYKAAIALLDKLPANIDLAKQDIASPAIDPYVLSVKVPGDGSAVLTGYVPDTAARTAVLAAARTALPGTKITDLLEVGAGAPDAFVRTASGLLPVLGQMENGELSFRGRDVSLSGLVTEQDAAEALGKSFTVAVTKPYRADTKIKYRNARKAVISPYLVSACYRKDGVLTLDGHVPDEEVRQAILSYAKQRFLGSTVADQLAIGLGAPEPRSAYVATVLAGLRAVSLVGGGCARLVDRTLTVEGVADAKGVPERISSILAQALPKGFVSNPQIALVLPPEPVKPAEPPKKVEVTIKVEPPKVEPPKAEPVPVEPPKPAEPPLISPFYTTAKYDGLNVTFVGVVPSDEARTQLLAAAAKAFPERTFTDKLVVARGSSPRWLDVMTGGLGQLAQLDAGQFTLSDKSSFLSGATDSERVYTNARKVAKGGFVAGYTGGEQLTYVAPPKPDPKIVATKQEQITKYDVGSLLKSDKELTGGECQAVLQSVSRRGQALFARGSAVIDAAGKDALDQLVPVAGRCPGAKIRIAGHTDSDGAATFNQRLSELRANAVVAYLGRAGVDKERLSAVGLGEAQPIVENDTPPNKALNRRIEFEVGLE